MLERLLKLKEIAERFQVADLYVFGSRTKEIAAFFRHGEEAASQPAFIFDGRNILDSRHCFDVGFNVFPIGKRPLTHF